MIVERLRDWDLSAEDKPVPLMQEAANGLEVLCEALEFAARALREAEFIESAIICERALAKVGKA